MGAGGTVMLVGLVGLGMALAGADKLAEDPRYDRMYAQWGWSRGQMRAAAAVEVIGGLLMAFPRTRRAGGALMAGASVPQLTAELNHGNGGLALARTGVLVVALAAVLG
jgi:hypothetical protein